MNLTIVSQKAFVLYELLKIIQEQRKEGYSSTIEFALAELVREYMRSIAQGHEYNHRRSSILEQAIKITENKIQNQLKEVNTQFNFTQYFTNIRESLKYPEKEIAELRANLLESKETKRIGERIKINSETISVYEITEIGLCNSLEGLLAFPLKNICEIDIEPVKKIYDVKGDWFPLEIEIGNLTFIVDDDGTIFVSSENFPEPLVLEAKQTLKRLADQLYVEN